MVVENKAKLQALEEENKILKEQIAKQEQNENATRMLGGSLEDEVKKIRRKGKSTANTITVIEKNDHVNVTLWTKWGKMVGSLHPDNAIQTLHRFADIGIALSTDRPTPEQAEAWSNSREGKAFFKKETEKRAIKDKSKRTGQMDRLCAEIARMSGTTVEAINKILPASEVGKK